MQRFRIAGGPWIRTQCSAAARLIVDKRALTALEGVGELLDGLHRRQIQMHDDGVALAAGADDVATNRFCFVDISAGENYARTCRAYDKRTRAQLSASVARAIVDRSSCSSGSSSNRLATCSRITTLNVIVDH